MKTMKTEKVLNQLKKYRNTVNKELLIFLDSKLMQAKKIDKSSYDMLKEIKEFTLRGGKRVRAAFIFFGYRCFSNKNLKEVVKASMAIELVQSFLLIHDDIIDRDDLRRGKSTIHKVFENYGKKMYSLNGLEKEHFGKSMAILTGDICSSLAQTIVADLKLNPEIKIKAIHELNNLICKTIYGETIDVLSDYEKMISKKDLSKIHYLKTASYTVEGPLLIGAILAGAKKKDLIILKEYAKPLGMAFQLQDDILGLFGDEKNIGKPIGSDIKEGKKTLLMIKAIEKANPAEKKFVISKLGKQNITKKDLEKIRQIVISSGSLDYSKNIAKKLINDSKKKILKERYNKDGKDFLIGIADYLLEREY